VLDPIILLLYANDIGILQEIADGQKRYIATITKLVNSIIPPQEQV
jgi:hypothetical protein